MAPLTSSSATGKSLAHISRIHASVPLFLRHHAFCSSPSSAGDDQNPPPSPTTERGKPPSSSTERGKERPLDETICYMMSRRPWTTRLQNSIRSLVPNFDQPLVLAVIRGAADPIHALRFFRWVEKTGFRHDSNTCREIISLLARNSMLNHARCILLDDMPNRLIPRDEPMMISLIHAYGHAHIPQEAVKLFRRMPDLGILRTAASYDAFFMAILRCGRAMMAKRVFNSMLRDGVTPTLSTYNTLIWGFCLSNKMKTALRFIQDMKQRGISPDIVTYNTLLNGWVRAKKMEDAHKVFAEMTESGFNPNCISYNILIKGYVSDCKVDDALRLFTEMGEKGLRPTDRTYSALLPGLCDLKDKAGEARKLLDEMIEHNITPRDRSIFSRLISCLCESGDVAGALDVYKAMDKFNIVPDAPHYGILIENFCKGGRYDNAVELMDELVAKGTLVNPQTSPLEAVAYNPLIEHMCSHGLTQKAEVFFRQLLKKGVDDKLAFNNLICGHAKEADPESAFELLHIMNRRGIETDSDAYVLLVESFLKKGEPADAKTALDSMIEQGHVPNASLFRSVMVALFDDGRVQTASRVMKTMIEKGVKENMDMMEKILEALFMRGHIEEALGRTNLMLMNGCAPEIDRLLLHLCDNGDPNAIHKLADFGLERDCDISLSTYDRVLGILDAADKTLPAYSLLCKIKEKGQVVNKKGCEAVIQSLIAQGNTKQADILSRMISVKDALGSKRGKKASMDA